METETMALPRPINEWTEEWIKKVYDECLSGMKFLDNTPTVSKDYSHCLQRGKKAIIENMMEWIMNTGYFKQQYGSSSYVLYWRDAPQGLAKFVQHLETVLTGEKEIKIRTNTLAPVVGVATNAPLPRPTDNWNENDIKILYEDCEHAMTLLGVNSSIVSEKYRQCLQGGSGVIMEKIMEFIMDTGYFKKQFGSTTYVLYWTDAPQGLARFLQRLETVFTGNEEIKIRKKRVAPVVVAAGWALAKPVIVSLGVSLGLSASYDILKEGLTYIYGELSKKDPKEQNMPPIASLVAFVEAPDPRLKCGVLKTYGQLKEGFSAGDVFQLELLQGKRLFYEKWAEEDIIYNPSGEAKAMLCMHLWSLMTYVGFTQSRKIWEVITHGWPECVSWKKEHYGNFWKIIDSDGGSDFLRVRAENKGLKAILNAYKDMQRHFDAEKDISHSLVHHETAYYPGEKNPYAQPAPGSSNPSNPG